MATIVSAPANLIVGKVDGIDIRFVGVEFNVDFPSCPGHPQGGRGARIKIDGIRGEETFRRDQQFLQAFEEWGNKRRGPNPELAGEPPTMPAIPVLERIQVTLTDDVGTLYRRVAGQVAGTSTEWDAAWTYAPTPPDTADTLTVRFILDDEATGAECQIRID